MIKNNMVFEITFELVFVVLKKDSVQYLFLNRPDKIKINEPNTMHLLDKT